MVPPAQRIFKKMTDLKFDILQDIWSSKFEIMLTLSIKNNATAKSILFYSSLLIYLNTACEEAIK